MEVIDATTTQGSDAARRMSAEQLRALMREHPELELREPYIALSAAGYPNVAAGLQYADDVLNGSIDACKWVRLACERNARDLERMATEEFPYTFDASAAERVLEAMQIFREIKGPTSGHRLRLQPWQKFVFGSLFGWLGVDTRTRRFRFALLYVPRGNGKTSLAAPLGLYMLALDGEGGAEVYAAAVTRQQARLVFDTAKHMARRDKEFCSRYNIEILAHAIVQDSQAATFRALSKDATSLDGLNVHLAILDELAQHPTGEVYDVLVTGMGKRKQSMLLGITTASANQSGIGYQQWRYAERVLSREVVDEQFFGMLYTIDEDDDWRTESALRKANPNWGVSVMPDVVLAACARAVQSPSRAAAFKQKHLNIWTNADQEWMDMAAWARAADETLNRADFAGCDCFIGIDLATKIDLAAVSTIFWRDIDGVTHYYLFTDFFLPQAAIDRVRNDNYAGWARDGYLNATVGECNDLNAITRWLLDAHREYHLIDLAYDPWQALQMAQTLSDEGVSVIEYRPTVQNFSAPMKEFDGLVREGRLHHDANPVMTYCISCVLVQEDFKGNIYPRKDKTDHLKKIDGVVASLMALGRKMSYDALNEMPSISSFG